VPAYFTATAPTAASNRICRAFTLPVTAAVWMHVAPCAWIVPDSLDPD